MIAKQGHCRKQTLKSYKYLRCGCGDKCKRKAGDKISNNELLKSVAMPYTSLQ